jgi:hypothetical protein
MMKIGNFVAFQPMLERQPTRSPKTQILPECTASFNHPYDETKIPIWFDRLSKFQLWFNDPYEKTNSKRRVGCSSAPHHHPCSQWAHSGSTSTFPNSPTSTITYIIYVTKKDAQMWTEDYEIGPPGPKGYPPRRFAIIKSESGTIIKNINSLRDRVKVLSYKDNNIDIIIYAQIADADNGDKSRSIRIYITKAINEYSGDEKNSIVKQESIQSIIKSNLTDAIPKWSYFSRNGDLPISSVIFI